MGHSVVGCRQAVCTVVWVEIYPARHPIRGVYPLGFMQQITPSLPLSTSLPFFLSILFSPNTVRRSEGLCEFGAFKVKIWYLVRIILVTFMKNYIESPPSLAKHSPKFFGAFAPKFIQWRCSCIQ